MASSKLKPLFSIESNLLGKTARVTMGCDAAAIARYQNGAMTPSDSHHWNQLNQTGEITAVFLTPGGEPACLLRMDKLPGSSYSTLSISNCNNSGVHNHENPIHQS